MVQLRVGLIGYGLAGSSFHAPLIETTAGLGLAMVVTADPERRNEVRREHPDAALVDNADELWSRAPDLDLVVIAAANDAHAELARRAVDAALPVVVDKPLAPTAAEAQAVVEHAASRGVL